jgi:hypothetical protein
MIGSDIDGTLLGYNQTNGEPPSINWPLIRTIAGRTDKLWLVTNQGGIPFSLHDPKHYPSADDFRHRLIYLVGAFALFGVKVVGIDAAVYHPKAPDDAVRWAEKELALALADLNLTAFVHIDPLSRKPGAVMLRRAGLTCYSGDSAEDERAADGIEFIRVPRFR